MTTVMPIASTRLRKYRSYEASRSRKQIARSGANGNASAREHLNEVAEAMMARLDELQKE
jgi:hypothetical protein